MLKRKGVSKGLSTTTANRSNRSPTVGRKSLQVYTSAKQLTAAFPPTKSSPVTPKSAKSANSAKSKCSSGGSIKRRRLDLDSDEENTAVVDFNTVRRLNYERDESDSEDDDND